MRTVKKIPYTLSNFGMIRAENYVYVDKTRFIEQIENENSKYHFLIRPRKFGKSLFLSTLRHYYDICYADKFDMLFGDLYIGQHPTLKRNSLFLMKFSFMGLDTSSVEAFKVSFTEAIRSSIEIFLTEHRLIIPDHEEKIKELRMLDNVRTYIEYAFQIIIGFGRKAYIIIDEYDHFANDLIALGTNLSIAQYKELIWANGVVRDFYETLKDHTEAVIDTIFITGVTPMMLDDVTSGFNISNNLSLKEKYCEILGFTEEEVEFVRQEAGIDKSLIKVDMEYLYNGYLFHEDAKNKLYNSSMVLYFFQEVMDEGEKIERLIDENIKTDYSRINKLLNKPYNINKLEQIIEFGKLPAKVSARFSIEKLHETKNFLSLLYYMGLVTIQKGEKLGESWLRIPNYTVKVIYWEYMENSILERNPEMMFDSEVIYDGLINIAVDGDYKPFFDKFQKNFLSNISNRDLREFSEKNIKFLLLSILYQNSFYLPISELENSEGYSDIYLQRRNYLYPKIQTDWVWELKYIKEADAGKKHLFAAKKKEALTQLQRYKNSNFFKDRTDVRYLAIVFVGKKKYWITEVT